MRRARRALCLIAAPALAAAEGAWPPIRAELCGARGVEDGAGVVTLAAPPPRRSADPLRAHGAAANRVRLSISHPGKSGMQMDQITLLHRPARFIETLEVWADETPLFTVTGSISLSENPQIAFDRPHAAQALRVRLTDTDGAVFERRFGLGAS